MSVVVYTRVMKPDDKGVVRNMRVRIGQARRVGAADDPGAYLEIQLDALPIDGRLEIHFEEDD